MPGRFYELSMVEQVHLPNTTGSAVGTFTGSEVNCSGWDRVHYIATGSAGGAGATMDLQVYENTVTGMSGSAAITSGSVQLTQATVGCQILSVPVSKTKPYQKVVAICATDAFPLAVVAVLGPEGTPSDTVSQDNDVVAVG